MEGYSWTQTLHHQLTGSSMPACRCRLVDRAGIDERDCRLGGWVRGWVAGTDELVSTSRLMHGYRLMKSS